MPRAIWSGAISFGLVSIPVKLYAATTSQTVRFHQLDAETGARVRQQRVSEADGSVVPYDRIVKGYELASGQHVVITDEELSSLDPLASRTIDLLEFVDQASIDPLYYESAYYLGPDPATVKPYALLLEAMGGADKVGIARFVMRGREHLCALRPDDGALVLSTMRYADEVRTSSDIAELDDVAAITLTDGELAMAGQLIASLDAEFDPERYHDSYRQKVLEMIEAKQRGDDALVAPSEPAEASTVVDLMAALEASVAEAKAARKRHPTATDAVAEEKPAAKARATKAPAKAGAEKTPAKKKVPAKKVVAKKASPQRKSA
jgi:DNA end-binding protein Ku